MFLPIKPDVLLFLFHKEALNRSISDYSSTLLLNSSPPRILKQKQLVRKQGYREDKYKDKDQECKLEISHKKEIDSIRKNKYQHAHRHTHWFCAMYRPHPTVKEEFKRARGRKEWVHLRIISSYPFLFQVCQRLWLIFTLWFESLQA